MSTRQGFTVVVVAIHCPVLSLINNKCSADEIGKPRLYFRSPQRSALYFFIPTLIKLCACRCLQDKAVGSKVWVTKLLMSEAV